MSDCLYSAEQVSEFDRCAIEDFKIPSYELMCRAGQVLLDIVQLRWNAKNHILIVCGAGNNAGDGYVLARLLSAYCHVNVHSAVDPAKLSGDAKRAFDDYQTVVDNPLIKEAPDVSQYDLIVDALFGIGLSRDIDGYFADLINAINQSGIPVLAVDVPSGLNATTGRVCGVAIKATVTATFIGNKQGLHTNDGPDCCGQIFLDDLNIPTAVFAKSECSVLRLNQKLLRKIPPRLRNAHKGSFGSALLIGGNVGMEGAIALAGQACLKVGAGLIKVAGPSNIMSLPMWPDIMRTDASDSENLVQLFKSMSVIAIGPGLGTNQWAQSCFELTMSSELPMVVDADALNILAKKPQIFSTPVVLTPHPAEAARLLGCTTMDIQNDRFTAVRTIAKQFNAIVVLKGTGTLISDGVSVFLCDRGNPSMSCAGMGDVLTGVIAGLLAQGLDVFDAANLGVYIHASSGDLAEHDLGFSLTASDVTDYLPKALMA